MVIGGIELFKDFFVSFLEGIQYKYVSTLLQKEVVFLKKEQKRNYMREGPLSGYSPTGTPNRGHGESQLSRATAAAQIKGIGDDLNPNVVMEAYISLLIEEYSDDLTSIVKMLDKLD